MTQNVSDTHCKAYGMHLIPFNKCFHSLRLYENLPLFKNTDLYEYYELVNKSVSDLTGLHIHNVWEIK